MYAQVCMYMYPIIVLRFNHPSLQSQSLDKSGSIQPSDWSEQSTKEAGNGGSRIFRSER